MRLRRELNANYGRGGELAPSELVGILIIVAVSVITLVLFTDIRDAVDSVEEGACAAQVRQAAAVGKVFDRDYPVDMSACQTKYRTIERGELPRDDSKAREEVKKILAEEMRTCWEQWGRGELELFVNSGQYCSFCTNVGFDTDTRKLFDNNGGRITGFHDYLEKTKSPKGMSYDELFTGSVVNIPEAAPIDQNTYSLSTDKNLTIVFFYDKSLVKTTLWQSILSTEGNDVTAAEAAAKAQGTIISLIMAGPVLKGGLVAAKGIREAAWIRNNIELISRVPGAGAGTAEGLARNVMIEGFKEGAKTAGKGTIRASSRIAANYQPLSGASMLLYAYMRANEEYGVLSAIYITRLDPNAPYVADCKTLATQQKSP